MSAGEQRNQQPFDDHVLPYDDLRHTLANVRYEIFSNSFHGMKPDKSTKNSTGIVRPCGQAAKQD